MAIRKPWTVPTGGVVLMLVGLAVLLAPLLAAVSVYPVDWAGRRAERIALVRLEPTPLLGVVALAIAQGLVWLAVRRRASLGTCATSAAPLLLLWWWAVPYLPWLPDYAPALLALAGPVRWVVLVGALIGCGWPLIARTWESSLGRIVPSPRLVFLASLVFYLVIGLVNARDVGPGGDEPHYLVIAHSLLVDRDLAIENNHERGDYRAFFQGDLRPDYLRRGRGGVIYSVHAPGLPALVLPAYALGGYVGVVVFLCVVAALAARVIYETAVAVAGPAAGLLTWAGVALTIPFVPHAWLIYPELPATLILAWTARWLWHEPPQQWTRWLLRGFGLALLPWLHTKFSLLLAALTVALLVRRWAGVKPALALLLPIAASLAGWLTSFYLLYGVANPTVQYGSVALAGLTLKNVPRGVLGLFFDQEFGLLLYSPVYWLVAVGAWRMARRPGYRSYGVILVAATVALLVSVTTAYMWWGGWSPPARFLVPTLPLAAPMLAVGFATEAWAGYAWFARTLLAVSWAVAAAIVGQPSQLLAFNDRDGVGHLIEALQGSAPLAATLPSFLEVDWRAPLGRVSRWTAAVVLAAVAAAWTARRARRQRPFWVAAATLMGFGVGFALLTARLLSAEPARSAAVRAGRMQLLEAYDGPRTLAIHLTRLTRLDEPALLQATKLITALDRGVSFEEGRIGGPFGLPAGEYQVRVWFYGRRPGAGELVLTGSRPLGTLAHAIDPVENPATLLIRLPVSVRDVWLRGSTPELARHVRLVEIEPRRVEPRHTRLPYGTFAAIEYLGDAPGRYLLYLDRNAYPEGGRFWTIPGRTAEVWVAPAGARTLRLAVHVGPKPAHVVVTVHTDRRELTLPPWKVQELHIPVRPHERFVPLRIATTTGFRPIDVDPASQDSRWLGCYVEVTLLDSALDRPITSGASSGGWTGVAPGAR